MSSKCYEHELFVERRFKSLSCMHLEWAVDVMCTTNYKALKWNKSVVVGDDYFCSLQILRWNNNE